MSLMQYLLTQHVEIAHEAVEGNALAQAILEAVKLHNRIPSPANAAALDSLAAEWAAAYKVVCRAG